MDQKKTHTSPKISICIPYYNEPILLKRNLESINIQVFRDFEVIITDDSPLELTESFLNEFSKSFPIHYYKNQENLGSPRNWNLAIDLAKGQYIIILHQDDYFSNKNSLTKYLESFSDSTVDFSFGKIDPEEKKHIIRKFPKWISNLAHKPEIILQNNIIGPPSNVMFRGSKIIHFDQNLIWAVDYELYFRMLRMDYKFKYINEQLVIIGKHQNQITNYFDQNPLLKLKENIYTFNKHKNNINVSLSLYDFYWRNFRNNNIKKENVKFKLEGSDMHEIMQQQINIQQIFGSTILKNGIISKLIMLCSWIFWKLKSVKISNE